MVTTATPPDLRQLITTAHVAGFCGLSLKQMNFFLYRLPASRRYKEFRLRRRNGSERIIQAPILPIKRMQKRVAAALEASYRAPRHTHGYVKTRGPLSNAQVHVRQRWVLRVDLKDFFPSIHFGRVRGLLLKPPFDLLPEVARVIAHMCCHEGALPHGAPSSPVISNWICRRLDRELAALAKEHHCFYSRYSDDLVFSTNRRGFPAALATRDSETGAIKVGERLAELIAGNGFVVNPEKTVLRQRTQRQMVTGIIVNEAPNVPRSYVRELRHLLYVWRSHGREAAITHHAKLHQRNRPPDKPQPPFETIVRGMVQHAGHVKSWHHPVYRALAVESRRVRHWDLRIRL